MNNLSIKNSLLLSSDASFKVKVFFIQGGLQVFGDKKGISQLSYIAGRGPFLCQKKSTSNKKMNFKMIGMHFRLKLSKQKT